MNIEVKPDKIFENWREKLSENEWYFDDAMRYRPKISGPETIPMRVNRARQIQSERFKDSKTLCNSGMAPAEIKKYCKLDASCREILR